MVYCYTSRNLKLLQSLFQDFRTLPDLTPYEYINEYFNIRFQTVDQESKISWLKEVFLGTHKYSPFLKSLAHQAGQLSDKEKDYFVIITYGILFQISPKNSLDIFKCMFNISKHLLNTFIMFFSSKDNMAIISQIAQSEYDKHFVIENILRPVSLWQPFLFEMSRTYFKYLNLNKGQTYNLKNSTSPVSLNKSYKSVEREYQGFFTQNFTPYIKKKVVTSTKIRQHHIHRKSKNKALRHTVNRNTNFYYFVEKITKKDSHLKGLCTKLAYKHMNSFTSLKEVPALETKTTKAVIKRLNNTVKKCEQHELKWFRDIIDNCENTLKVDELLKYDRQEREKERLLSIKRNYLMGQISHEEAVIAKKKMFDEKKRKYINFIREKEQWDKELEEWKLNQTEYNRKQVEKLSLIELNLLAARNSLIAKRKEMAEIVRYDTKVLKELALKNKEAELERRVNMIKEIKELSMCAKESRMHKTINLNESPGFGLLCEMSIAELQKRLATLKISFQEKLDEKKNKIKMYNVEKKQELEETKKSNYVYMAEKERLRILNKSKIKRNIVPTDEINQLEKMLEKKRNQRKLLTQEMD